MLAEITADRDFVFATFTLAAFLKQDFLGCLASSNLVARFAANSALSQRHVPSQCYQPPAACVTTIIHTREILVRSRVLLVSVLGVLAAEIDYGWTATRCTQDCVPVVFAGYAL